MSSSDDENGSCNKGSSTETFVKKPDPAKSDMQSTSQPVINLQILAQLQALGSRLDAMEKKSCKKSNDITKIKNKSTKPKAKPHTAVTPSPVHQSSLFNDLQSMVKPGQMAPRVHPIGKL